MKHYECRIECGERDATRTMDAHSIGDVLRKLSPQFTQKNTPETGYEQLTLTIKQIHEKVRLI